MGAASVDEINTALQGLSANSHGRLVAALEQAQAQDKRTAALVEMFGETLKSKSGDQLTVKALAGKDAIALYFSASWCQPCREFTPDFIRWYTDAFSAKGLEIVLVSSDDDEAAFDTYYEEQPWL